MIKTFIYAIIIVLAVIGISHWLGSPASTSTNSVPTGQTMPQTIETNKTAPRNKQPAYVQPNPVQVQRQLQIQTQNGVVNNGTVFPADQSFVINASDSGADLTSISVPRGIRVTLTINVSTSGSGHGGLDFKSPIVNTNTIAPGGSIVTGFVSDKPFVITPYWPGTNTTAPFRISVSIQ